MTKTRTWTTTFTIAAALLVLDACKLHSEANPKQLLQTEAPSAGAGIFTPKLSDTMPMKPSAAGVSGGTEPVDTAAPKAPASASKSPERDAGAMEPNKDEPKAAPKVMKPSASMLDAGIAPSATNARPTTDAPRCASPTPIARQATAAPRSSPACSRTRSSGASASRPNRARLDADEWGTLVQVPCKLDCVNSA